jgi:hypothetical protein
MSSNYFWSFQCSVSQVMTIGEFYIMYKLWLCLIGDSCVEFLK